MTNYDEQFNKISTIEFAIKNNIGTKEEINLYQQLYLALELINDDFKIIYSEINDGIHFGIITDSHGLPESVGLLFFNVDLKFNIRIKEANVIDDSQYLTSEFGCKISNLVEERYFLIKISS